MIVADVVELFAPNSVYLAVPLQATLVLRFHS